MRDREAASARERPRVSDEGRPFVEPPGMPCSKWSASSQSSRPTRGSRACSSSLWWRAPRREPDAAFGARAVRPFQLLPRYRARAPSRRGLGAVLSRAFAPACPENARSVGPGGLPLVHAPATVPSAPPRGCTRPSGRWATHTSSICDPVVSRPPIAGRTGRSSGWQSPLLSGLAPRGLVRRGSPVRQGHGHRTAREPEPGIRRLPPGLGGVAPRPVATSCSSRRKRRVRS